ncbi:MAG: iron-containing alcohol dehydrogenase [Clostridiales Family XIII bacterium]|jgi:alcohol dehydrogenase|nr:iron-containing alcohol dehydrogenase [Clostridiales Family XIII bacterium]
MMQNFEFVLPTRIRFGAGISKEIAAEIHAMGKKRPFIITDEGIVRAGLADRVAKALKDGGFTDYFVFDETEPNPRDTTVQHACEKAKEWGADVLVALGGGSSMDTAKGAAVLLSHGGSIHDYEGLGKVTKPVTDLIAIPTTVGTGSEVTFWAVITDTKRHFKMSVGSPLIAPKLALVDPDLVQSLPPTIVASTGMDALTHAIEGYTCALAEPITDACGLYAIRMISENLRDAVYGGPAVAVEARANMLLGSLIAGICFGNSDIAGVHCMAEALGGLYDTPHGIANAILLPHVMKYNFVSDLDKFAEVAKALGERGETLSMRDLAYASVTAVLKLNADLNIPSLFDVGANVEDLPELAKRASVNVSVGSNPRRAGEAEFLTIFQSAFLDEEHAQ